MLLQHGMSIGIGDTVADVATGAKIGAIIDAAKEDVQRIIEQYQVCINRCINRATCNLPVSQMHALAPVVRVWKVAHTCSGPAVLVAGFKRCLDYVSAGSWAGPYRVIGVYIP